MSNHRGSATNERDKDGRGACRFESCVSRHVDGELDAVQATDVENHLAECASCDEHAKLLQAMKVSLRRRCGARASDELRAKLSLVLARESAVADRERAAPAEDRLSMETPLLTPVAPAVSSISTASSPPRESLVGGAHDRAQLARATRSERSARVAYGVGAFAVAAGVAMAVAGERIGESLELARDQDAPTRIETGSIGNGTSGRRAEAAPSRGGYGYGPSGVGVDGMAAGTGLVPVANAPSSGITLPPLMPSGTPSRASFDTLLDDMVALHANPLPPETTNPDDVRKYDALVGVKVRRPTLRAPYLGSYRGARLHAMRDAQRTAMLQYVLRDGHHVTVYVFNPREMQLGTTHLTPRVVRDEPIYVGSVRGYSVAAAERRGVGYALATDMDTDDSVKMVATSLP